MPDQLVYVYGPHSRVHVAVRHDRAMLTNERCNMDELVGARIVVDSIDDVPAGHEHCERCLPKAVAAGAILAVGENGEETSSPGTDDAEPVTS